MLARGDGAAGDCEVARERAAAADGDPAGGGDRAGPVITAEQIQEAQGQTTQLPSFDEARDEFTRNYLVQLLQITQEMSARRHGWRRGTGRISTSCCPGTGSSRTSSSKSVPFTDYLVTALSLQANPNLFRSPRSEPVATRGYVKYPSSSVNGKPAARRGRKASGPWAPWCITDSGVPDRRHRCQPQAPCAPSTLFRAASPASP